MALWAISGGRGFLGVHLTRRLLAGGRPVRTLDRTQAVVPGDDQLHGDLRDPAACARLCREAEVLVHAAAALPSGRRWSELREVNVGGTATLLAAAADSGIRRVVFLSSAVVYGLSGKVPSVEETPPAPIEPYGASKLEAENVCRAFAARGLDTVILRPSAVVGPERLGIFGLLFRWVREGRRLYTLGPGSNRYQLLDVGDLVDAILLAAADRPLAGETFNVGAAVTGTVAQDLVALVEHAGSTSRLTAIPAGPARALLRTLDLVGLSPLTEWHYRTADRDVVASVEKARRVLGWEPSRSSAGALMGAYDWFVENGASAPAGDTHRATWHEGALGLVRRLS